jgi:uncharacterized protein (UPF0335 family)
LNEAKKGVFSEAKGEGFDVKVLVTCHEIFLHGDLESGLGTRTDR